MPGHTSPSPVKIHHSAGKNAIQDEQVQNILKCSLREFCPSLINIKVLSLSPLEGETYLLNLGFYFSQKNSERTASTFLDVIFLTEGK